MGQFDRLLFVGTFTADQKRAKAFLPRRSGSAYGPRTPRRDTWSWARTRTGLTRAWSPGSRCRGWARATRPPRSASGRSRASASPRTTWRRRWRPGAGRAGRPRWRGGRKQRDDKSGVTGLAFVTIIAKDTKRSAGFFTNALGMTGAPTASGRFTEYRLAEEATAVMPFTPDPAMYDDASEAAGDLAHLGEDTNIVFTSPDIQRAQAFLMSRGVRFKRKAEASKWGGWEAEFYDADDNIYWLSQPAPAKRPSSK